MYLNLLKSYSNACCNPAVFNTIAVNGYKTAYFIKMKSRSSFFQTSLPLECTSNIKKTKFAYDEGSN